MLKKISTILLGIFLTLCLIFGTFFTILYFGGFGKIPSEKELMDIKNESASIVYSSEKEIIGKYFAENRTNIPYADLPKSLVNALVATEDARYFQHEGVDSRSMIRVLIKSLLLGDKSAGGGSTISQQLAKNLFGRKEYGRFSIAVNKFKEMILARRLENMYTKEEILNLYLNTVPFGENIYGIEAASQRFFHTSTSQLKIEEAAVLVGILKANTYYNPRLYPENALMRRNVVLGQMHKYEYLSKEKFDSLKSMPLELNYSNLDIEGPAQYFLVEVRKEADSLVQKINRESNSNYDIEKDGLKITTTLNLALQKHCQQAMTEHLSSVQHKLRAQYKSTIELQKLAVKIAQNNSIDLSSDTIKNRELFDFGETKIAKISQLDSLKHALTQLHAGMIGLDPLNGSVLAWVAGLDFHRFPYDQILAKRQLASTFKPILYAAAIEKGVHACDYLGNDAMILTDYDNWEPQNYDGSSGGEYSVAAALAFSKNIPTVNLFFRLGYDSLLNMWNRMGFSSKLDDQPSVALGTASANLWELSIAYASFANYGLKVEPYFIESIENAEGEVIYQHADPKHARILSEKTAIQMNEILLKATNEGTGVAMRSRYGINIPLAGKTGTSQDFADAWYVCYTDQLLLASRVGASYPNIHFNTGKLGSGSSLALPLAGICLKNTLKDPKTKNLLRSANLKSSNEIDCPDFREDTALEEFFKQFKDEKTTREKQQKKQKRKKKGFLERLFGN